jgi:MoaA/NifB/PqqE/SkfB family radical SAM enzyme
MPWDVFKRSVAIALESRIRALNFFGGEPLLNPQFFPMLELALERDFSLILATNCRPLAEEGFFTRFLDITQDFKKRIVIITARDKFHLRFFDPMEIIERLRNESYEVVVNDYSNHIVLLSEFNANKQELYKLNSRFSCCGNKKTDHIGVLPDGGWTICPPSLESFGNIFLNSLEEIIEFKSGLQLHCEKGCSICLKDFKKFHEQFESRELSKNYNSLKTR